MFYNVENLFDTIDDPHTRDNDFLPRGRYRWDGERCQRKIENIAYVLGDIADVTGEMPTIIALCEVETREVVEQLAEQSQLVAANYQVVHYDSPDQRGIDCALLYSPDRFHLEGSAAYRSIIEGEPRHRSRDMLTMWGTIDGEQIFILVGHWSSRLGGVRKSEYKRIAAAQLMRRVIDSVASLRPMSRFIAMGDFNDNPDDESIVTHLRAKGSIEHMGDGDLFNPFYAYHIAKLGSQVYRDLWSMTDNIVVSKSLVDGRVGALQLRPTKGDNSLYGVIFSPSYLLEREGRYRGYPHRSYRAGVYLDGYSDHLPIYITLD
ncbi:MAG: endonuclease/exonuclease/phosphatase family protein [Rikenellaceae bacterium]